MPVKTKSIQSYIVLVKKARLLYKTINITYICSRSNKCLVRTLMNEKNTICIQDTSSPPTLKDKMKILNTGRLPSLGDPDKDSVSSKLGKNLS